MRKEFIWPNWSLIVGTVEDKQRRVQLNKVWRCDVSEVCWLWKQRYDCCFWLNRNLFRSQTLKIRVRRWRDYRSAACEAGTVTIRVKRVWGVSAVRIVAFRLRRVFQTDFWHIFTFRERESLTTSKLQRHAAMCRWSFDLRVRAGHQHHEDAKQLAKIQKHKIINK